MTPASEPNGPTPSPLDAAACPYCAGSGEAARRTTDFNSRQPFAVLESGECEACGGTGLLSILIAQPPLPSPGTA